MRHYETIYILRPDVDEGVHVDVRDRLDALISGGGGEVERHESWGRKRLAYLVKKNAKGQFMYLLFTGPGELIAELERNLRLIEPVLKFQTVRLGEGDEEVRPFSVEPMPDDENDDDAAAAADAESDDDDDDDEAETEAGSDKAEG